jgi:TPR repeat protein
MHAVLLLASLNLPAQGTRATQDTRRLRPEQAATRVALVIGNGAYKDAPLRNPMHDAQAMAAALRACGFEVEELENAGRAQLFTALRNFRTRGQGATAALFFYAGHGMQVKGRNYLIPVDADVQTEEEVGPQALEAQEVLDQMEAMQAQVKLIILDACRNNPFVRSFRGGSRGLAQMDAPMGSFIAYATAPGMTAADGSGQNGLFTENLLKALKQPGLTVEQVFKRVRVGVANASRGQQVPWDSSSLTGEFFFVPGVDAAALPVSGPIPSPVGTSRLPAPTAEEEQVLDGVRVKGSFFKPPVEQLAKRLAAKGSPYAQFALGWASDNQQVAHQAILHGAKQGVPLAMTFLAESLANTPVSPEDPLEARNWLDKAIALGEPRGKLILGELLMEGKLGNRDIPLAERLFAEVTRDYPAYCADVGSFYWDDAAKGIPKEEADAKGLAYWKREAERGEASAMGLLGDCYWMGQNVKQDLKEAERWLFRAANNGDESSMFRLGQFYSTVEDIQLRHGEEAIRWFARAAEKGNPYAVVDMADLYREGKLVPQNYPRAQSLYRGGAEGGDQAAQERLGEMYEKGQGLPPSATQAYFWYVLGWDDIGWEFGRVRMEGLLNKTERTKIEAQAVAWRRTRAEQGNHAEQARLGEMYEKGLGVSQSLSQAYFWEVLAGDDWEFARERLAGQLPAAERARIEAQAAKWKPKRTK